MQCLASVYRFWRSACWLIIWCCLPTSLFAQVAELDVVRWAVEVKYGEFTPDDANFRVFYGDDFANHAALAVAYKPWRIVDVGIEVGHTRNTGRGSLPLNAAAGGPAFSGNVVTYRTNPVHLYALVRGVWKEDQIAVPYIGAGLTQIAYSIDIDNQPSRDGKADGSHTRFGVQFLLNKADSGAAASLENDFSIQNTYFYIEQQEIDVDLDGVQLGGETLFAGFLFEF